MSKQREIGQQAQEKFQFYAVSLMFTLLALSIQTAKFGPSKAATTCELLGWVCLLVAGIVFLWKLEYAGITHYVLAEIGERDRGVDNLLQVKQAGETRVVTYSGEEYPIDEVIANRRANLEAARANLKKLVEPDELKYRVAKYSFVAGLVFVVLARALPPAVDIFGYYLH